MEINLATSWKDLTTFQLKNIAYLLLKKKEGNIIDRLIFYLFIPELTAKNLIKFKKVTNRVLYKDLYPYLDFLNKPKDCYFFPKTIIIKDKVFYAPGDFLSNLTIEEFSAADLFFYKWNRSHSVGDLDRLITILYREKSEKPNPIDIREAYSVFTLKERGKYIPLLDIKMKYAIILIYMACRERIIKKYPVVFPSSIKSVQQENKKNKKYSSFQPVILSMSMDDSHPLGNYNEVKKTLIDPFFSILTEQLLRIKEKEKQLRMK